jgi:hypothetical protein
MRMTDGNAMAGAIVDGGGSSSSRLTWRRKVFYSDFWRLDRLRRVSLGNWTGYTGVFLGLIGLSTTGAGSTGGVGVGGGTGSSA